MEIKDKVKLLESIIKDYNQHTDDSMLWQDIKAVLGCSDKEAKKFALTHCNSVSWYAILFTHGLITISYQEYFKIGLGSGTITDKGFINDKPALCKEFGFDYDLKFATDKWIDITAPSRLDENKLYQIRICTGRNLLGKKKQHFIAAAILNGLFRIYDTGDRGIGVSAVKAITEKQFEKAIEV